MDSASYRQSDGQGQTSRAVLWGLLCAGMSMASANQVTYQVNMGVQRAWGNFNPANGDAVVVSGTFSANNWTTTSVLIPSVADSNIYVGTFNNDVPNSQWEEHKFILNRGGNSPAGELIWESRNNRSFQVSAGNQILPVVDFDDLTNAPASPGDTSIEFVAGADMSHLVFFEDRGIVYRTNGQPHDALEILKESGLNCVRLRLFTSSAAQAESDPYNYVNNLDYTLPLAVRVKNAGLKFLLDFHYSDTWADPGDQLKPDAWSSLNFNQLEQQIQDYNSNTIATLRAAGAMPDYVQVGNEIIGGMLWDDGRVSGGFDNPTQWDQFGRLLKAAVNGIHGAAGATPPLIIIHIDRGGDWESTRRFFDKLDGENVPYDIIGQSYYPWWHGDLDDLAYCLNNTAGRYGKPVIIAETAYPWTNEYNPDTGLDIPASQAGQIEFVMELTSIMKALPGGRGRGIVWWGSEYVQLDGYGLAGFQRRSFFDYGGNELPVVDTLGTLTSEVVLSAVQEGDQLAISWPLSGAGMSLTTTTSPAPYTLWMAVTNSIVSTGGILGVTVPVDVVPQQLFRLKSD